MCWPCSWTWSAPVAAWPAAGLSRRPFPLGSMPTAVPATLAFAVCAGAAATPAAVTALCINKSAGRAAAPVPPASAASCAASAASAAPSPRERPEQLASPRERPEQLATVHSPSSPTRGRPACRPSCVWFEREYTSVQCVPELGDSVTKLRGFRKKCLFGLLSMFVPTPP